MEKETINVGDTVVINEQYIGVRLFKVKGQYAYLNVIDMKTKQSAEFVLDNHKVRIATKEERRMYWDNQVGTTPEKHCDDDNIFPAGSVVVFGERYFALIATDIPKQGTYPFVVLDMLDTIALERCEMPNLAKFGCRRASELEAIKFYKKLLNY